MGIWGKVGLGEEEGATYFWRPGAAVGEGDGVAGLVAETAACYVGGCVLVLLLFVGSGSHCGG